MGRYTTKIMEDYNLQPPEKLLRDLKRFLKEVRECEERKQLFEYWRIKLELPERVSIREFMDKLKLYQNLYPDE